MAIQAAARILNLGLEVLNRADLEAAFPSASRRAAVASDTNIGVDRR